MTKFLSKLFLCGILLSSVNGYCQEKGLLITAMGGTPISDSENVTINKSTCNIVKDYETHYDIVVGSLIDGLDFNDGKTRLTVGGSARDCEPGNAIVAKDFPYATATTSEDDTITWTETYGSKTVIPLNVVGGYYETNAKNKIYRYVNGYSDSDYNSGEVYTKVSGEWKTANNEPVTIQFVDLTNTALGFKKDENNKNILFSGNVAYNDNGTWKLLPGGTPSLEPALLQVANGQKLTICDKQTTVGEATVNSASAQLTVTQLGEIKGPATIELLNDDFDPNDTSTQTQWATSVVLEPGSSVGESGQLVSISNGIVDLSGYITKEANNNPGFNTKEANKLHLTLNSTVNLFDKYIASTATAADQKDLIKNFNGTTIETPVFNDVTSVDSTENITVNIPYVLTDGKNSWSKVSNIPNVYLNGITDDETTIELQHIDKSKISGLFKSGATINYDMNAKTILKELISALNDQNPAKGMEERKTITIKAAAFKDFDSSIDFDGNDFKGNDDASKKFKIVVSKVHDKVSELEVKSTGDGTETIAEVDGEFQPADTYKEPNMSSAAGTVKSQYKNINNATIVPNTANNNTNGAKGPDTTISNSNANISLTDNTKMNSLTLDTSNIVINGNSHELQLGNLSLNEGSKATLVGMGLSLG